MNEDMNKHGSNRNSISEMEQIQRGLEEFLQQELREMKAEKAQSPEKESIETDSIETQPEEGPQFFTIGEEENREKEIDIIGSAGKNTGNGRYFEDDYFEDWDSPKQKSTGRARGTGSTDTEDVGRTGSIRNTGSAKRGKSTKNRNVQASGRQSAAESGGRTKKQKKKRKKKSGLKRFLIAAVLIIALGMGGIYFAVGAVYGKLHFEEIESVAAEPLKEDGVVNVLLIGNDSRQNGEDGRSDAMILLSISNKTKKIYMTSLLRDMYVEIPGHDGNRLNAAYSYGGAELLMETVEQNFDIPVNRYVLVNFEAFANLVDAVGGIELELTSEEIEYVNGYLVEYNMLTNRPQGTDNMDTSVSGLVHLNGPQALAYSRNRYLGTDFGRTERQRKVLEAVIRKVPKALITNPKGLFEGLMPNLTTNLTQTECFRLSLMAPKLLTYDIVQTSIPQEGTYQNVTIRKMQVLEVDFEANKKYLKENIYGSVK